MREWRGKERKKRERRSEGMKREEREKERRREKERKNEEERGRKKELNEWMNVGMNECKSMKEKVDAPI